MDRRRFLLVSTTVTAGVLAGCSGPGEDEDGGDGGGDGEQEGEDEGGDEEEGGGGYSVGRREDRSVPRRS
jgi:hypothetical protein